MMIYQPYNGIWVIYVEDRQVFDIFGSGMGIEPTCNWTFMGVYIQRSWHFTWIHGDDGLITKHTMGYLWV